MDCLAYCTATSYFIKPLFEALRISHKTTLYRDVIHLEMASGDDHADAFIFSYGAVVCWGLVREEGWRLLQEIKEFEDHPRDELETDSFTYLYGDEAKIDDDEIIFADHKRLSKLAVSHAIAQSVKLGTFETTLQKAYNNNKQLPEQLALHGKIPLSRYDIRRKMGELFIERSSINLHLDILDAPEFFWEYPELKPLYKMTSFYLDLETRIEILNHRLDVAHELFQMLGNELNHQHSSRLEWTIILLIVIEVILTLAKDLFKLM